jgi:hypothetical protein
LKLANNTVLRYRREEKWRASASELGDRMTTSPARPGS